MILQKNVATRIKEIINEKKLNQYKVYKLTGIPQSTLSTIIKGELKTIKLSTLYDFCAGLNIEFSEFFECDYLKLKNIED